MEELRISAALAGALGVLMVLLSSHVSSLRMRHKVTMGHGSVPALERAIRSHGNAAEHVPIILLLSLVYELRHGSDMLLMVCAAGFFIGRVLFSWGLLNRRLSKRRQIGAGINYLAEAVLAVALLVNLF